MEGGRGNRGKARLRRNAASVDDTARDPTFHTSAGLTLTTVTLHSLVSYSIPIERLRVIRASITRNCFRARIRFRKNAFDFVTFFRKYSLFLFNFATILDSPNRATRAEFRSHRGFTRPHEIVNRSRETSPLTNFGNHFIAHSLVAQN